MEIDTRLNQFRIASRELFNHFFHIDQPNENNQAWVLAERYHEIEELLFSKLVTEPANLPSIAYGVLNPNIQIALRHGSFAPIMLNREIDSGYWDYPLSEVNLEAKLGFIAFFDWDLLDYRDHRYVRGQILEWPSQPAVVGKHALIETQYVRFHES